MVAKLRRCDVAIKKKKKQQARSKKFLFPACQLVAWFSGYDLSNFLYCLLLQMVGGADRTGQWWPNNGTPRWKALSFVLPGPCGCEVINNDGGLCHAHSCPHQTANNATITPKWLTVFSDSLWKTMKADFPQWGLKMIDFSGLCGSKAQF